MIEEVFLKELPQISISAVAIIVIVWFAVKTQNAYNKREEQHDENIKSMQKQMCQEREQFVNYIDEHNHVFTDLVKQCTISITSSTENIRQNTDVLKEVAEMMRSIRKYN